MEWKAVLVASFVLVVCLQVQCAPLDDVLAERDRLLADEARRMLGGQLVLNAAEEAVNAALMMAKMAEYDRAQATLDFVPAINFFQSKPSMMTSQVYQFIRQMPKGGVLHIHDTAVTPIEFVINDASYRPGLYVCAPVKDPIFFQFASSAPSDLADCKWELVATRRQQEGAAQFDAWLRSKLSLYAADPAATYPNINSVWTAFENTLIATSGIVTYAPVFSDYFYQGLQSFYDDNVQYLEIRTVLPTVYYLNGTVLDELGVAGLYKATFDKFKLDHPDFTGAKIIFAPLRRVDNGTMARYLSVAGELVARYPDIVAGFDLVGQEDLGPPLRDFLGQLVASAGSGVKYFFHAGETDWLGTDVDENLVDAVLLNTTRIGHGFAISKHPAVMEMAKTKGIPVEVCPISNQVLALVADLRNHPASGLFTDGFPLVVSSDDPASWEAVGLSSDFYMAFVGLSGRRSDLKTLKQLAINSIQYSAMSPAEKSGAVIEWQKRWDRFIASNYDDDFKTMDNLTL